MPVPLMVGGLVVVLALPGSPPGSCSLLTPADIEAAAGARPDEPQPGSMQLPGTSQTMQMCTWVARPQTWQIMISTAPLPTGTDVKALAKTNKGMDALRAQKWTEESKDFGNAWCNVMSPPAGIKQPMFMSACTSGSKGTILSVTYISPTKKLSIDQTKTLHDKAAARLP